MTANEVIEAALLRIEDLDAAGRTKVKMLSYLRSFCKMLYEFVINYKLYGVPGFDVSIVSAAALDSDGKYSLPADHYRTARVWPGNYTKPAKVAPLDWIRNVAALNSDYSSGSGSVYYCIYNSYWYFKPISGFSPDIYYFPTLDTLNLVSTMPGGGMIDEAAIDFLVDREDKDDRFDIYDVSFSNSDKNVALQRAKVLLLNYANTYKTVYNPVHSYTRTRTR